MFMTIVSVRIFVSCFARVERNVKTNENLMVFVIFVIFKKGVLCQDICKMSINFGSIVFLYRIKEV